MKCSICALYEGFTSAEPAIGQCIDCGRQLCKQHAETCCDSLFCEFCHESHIHTVLPPESEILTDLLSKWLLPTARKEREPKLVS